MLFVRAVLFLLIVPLSATYLHVDPGFNFSTPREAFLRLYQDCFDLRWERNQTTGGHQILAQPKLESDATANVDVSAPPGVEQVLERTYENYEVAVRNGKLAKHVVSGNTEEITMATANYLYETFAGPFVEKAEAAILAGGGSAVGTVVGGLCGAVIGIFQPELEIPLIMGGEVIGQRVGMFLGKWGAKITSELTNDLIEEKILDPAVQNVFEANLTSFITELIESDAFKKNVADNNHGLCEPGYYDSEPAKPSPNCRGCSKSMEYSSYSGAFRCDRCAPGSKGMPDPYHAFGPNTHCDKCRVGTAWFATGDDSRGGECKECRGDKSYSDAMGLIGCKTCPEGTEARPDPWHVFGPNVRCDKAGVREMKVIV